MKGNKTGGDRTGRDRASFTVWESRYLSAGSVLLALNA